MGLHARCEPGPMARRMSRVRSWLDATPLAAVAIALMREATGRTEPLEVIRPVRPERLDSDARVGVWSLAAGVGTSTTAALVAQRSAAAGHAPILIDADRWAPSLALRAGIEAATLADALLQPDRERELVSRWGDVPFLPGSPRMQTEFDPSRVSALVERLARGRAAVIDLGVGADALDPAMTERLTRLCVVAGPGRHSCKRCSARVMCFGPCLARWVSRSSVRIVRMPSSSHRAPRFHCGQRSRTIRISRATSSRHARPR